jgi:ketosteroid isomerase-like protein
VLVAVGCVIVFVTSFVASGLAASVADSREKPAIEQAVLDFDAAYANQDCEAFRALVADDLADQLVDDDFDCESWVSIAESLRLDGEYAYSVEVLRVDVDGDWAGAYTEELDASSQATNYYYELERSADAWIIVSYTLR